VFVRSEITDIDSGDETVAVHEDEYEVTTLAMWDTGNALTIVCAEYLGISVPDRTSAFMTFE